MLFPSRRQGGLGSGEQSVEKKISCCYIYKKSLILVNLLCNICGGWS